MLALEDEDDFQFVLINFRVNFVILMLSPVKKVWFYAGSSEATEILAGNHLMQLHMTKEV